MIAKAAHPALCAGVLALATAGCRYPAALSFEGDGRPIAVGASAPLALGYESCGHETLLPYNLCIGNDVREMKSITVADPAVLAVVEPWQLDHVLVRATAAGQTEVMFDFVDAHGEQHTHSATIQTRAVDRVGLDAECQGELSPQPAALPAGSQQGLLLELRSGDVLLAGTGLVPLEPGALTLLLDRTGYDAERGLQRVFFELPAAATDSAIHSSVDPQFAFQVEVYEPSVVDGLRLLPLAPGPFAAQDQYGYVPIDFAVTTHGRPVCRFDVTHWPVTAVVETPEICPEFKSSLGRSAPGLVVQMRRPGICRVTASIEGTDFTAELLLEVVEPQRG